MSSPSCRRVNRLESLRSSIMRSYSRVVQSAYLLPTAYCLLPTAYCLLSSIDQPMPTILVVDDDKQIARLIRSYLEQAGFQVLVAYDGETALHALRRERPDLMVLDLMLPDRDGWDVTRIVRGDPALAGTPIIMVTARVEDTDRIVGLELGADDYVTKPFNPREIVARVRAGAASNVRRGCRAYSSVAGWRPFERLRASSGPRPGSARGDPGWPAA